MKQQLTLSFLLLFALASHAQELLEKTITVDGLEREYLLYVPAAYDGSEDWPLMFNLHGAGSNPEEQLASSGMNTVADTGLFLVAYPLGIENGDGLDGTGWNTNLLPDFQDDVLFFNNLIDTIASEYTVDLARVYACGMSNGGGMSFTLSCTLPERFAAVASVASPGVLEDCNPQRPFPFLCIQGTEDEIVPFNGGQSSLPLNFEFPGARERIQFSLDNNGCTLDSTVIEFEDVVPDDNSTISVRKFTNCNTYIGANGEEQSAEVWFYIIENGGHVWPGVSLPPFFGNSNLDINASTEIWNFFQRHTLPRQPQLLEKTITVDGLEREYLLYIPAAYDGSEDWPLVLNLHGYTGNAAIQVGITRMNPVADTAHFLIAYPDGEWVDISDLQAPDDPLPPENFGWNLGGLLSDNDDLVFLEQMIGQIKQEYTVDESRVYACGHSMGGIMTYYLACSLADELAAVASVAGTQAITEGPISIPCEPATPMPVFHIHGTADQITPYEDGNPFFLSPEGTVDFWRAHNGCASNSTESELEDINTDDESTVTSIQYNDCNGETEVWLYRIDGGGHWWPGGSDLPPGLENNGPVNRDISGSAEIWKFFNRHNLETNTTTGDLNASALGLHAYPNPASGFITFEFELPEAARSALTLYTPIGQPLPVLSNEMLPAGRQQFRWRRPVGMPAGLYYYQLRIDQQRIGGTVVLGQ